MRWLTDNPRDVRDLVSLVHRKDAPPILRPFILCLAPAPLGTNVIAESSEPSKRELIPCWLEFAHDLADLPFLVRNRLAPQELQTPETWMSLRPYIWDIYLPNPQTGCSTKVIVPCAFALRVPGRQIGFVKLNRGILWTMLPTRVAHEPPTPRQKEDRPPTPPRLG